MTEFKKWLDHNKSYLEEAYKVLDMEGYTLRVWELAQPQWQPIETAPESGPFLVHGGMFRSESYADSKTREAVKVSGRAPYIMFHNKGDILFYVADASYHEVWVVNPTHWMPLPEAPQGEDK